jgi:hypothetical protein
MLMRLGLFLHRVAIVMNLALKSGKHAPQARQCIRFFNRFVVAYPQDARKADGDA